MKLKLTTLGGILTVLLFVSAAVAISVSVRTSQDIEKMEKTWLVFEKESGREVVLLQRLNAALGYGGMIHQFKNYVLRQDKSRVLIIRTRMEEALAVIKEYQSLSHGDEERIALEAIKGVLAKYQDGLEKVEGLVAAGASIREIDNSVKVSDEPALDALKTLTTAFVAAQKENIRAIETSALQTKTFSRNGAIFVAVILVMAVLFLAWFMMFRLGRPLRALTMVMGQLSQGDTSVVIEAEARGDELGDMASAVAVFKENALQIAAMEETARAVVGSIAVIADQVQKAINDQAASSSEQAASVAQTSTSLEEIRETSGHARDRAEALSNAAKRTLSEGEIGTAEMTESVAAVESIRDKVGVIAKNMITLSEQNRKVGEITASVNNLAQQSKMLAVNASIEAAKAGEAGKGFAVVAEEMGNLAEQSEEATQQVRGVLDEIQSATEKAVLATEEGTKQVDVGVTLIQSASTRINNLNQVIGDTATETARIVGSVKQQSGGIEQVSLAMGEISKVTSQFASTSRQIQEAMERLTGEVDELVRARG